MKTMEMNISINTDLESAEWMEQDDNGACIPFIRAGFRNTEELMGLRVFDMLNILGIDRIKAEEMMYALYRFFNEDRQADEDIYSGVMDQYFDFAEWKQKHPEDSRVLVKDIIMEEGMNQDAMEALFDRVVRKFWKSPEYTREYRYWSYKDIAGQKERED